MMNRRRFAVSVCGCVAGLALSQGSRVQAAPAPRDVIELKSYVCSSTEKRDRLVRVFDEALIPALNRLGAKKVGVLWTGAELNEGNTNGSTTVWVVAAFPSLEACAASERALLADPAFVKAAAPLFEAPMKDPLFDSCSSALLAAFETVPQVKQVTSSPDRLLQLRIYNSYTTERNAKKVAMFEQGGEIGIFRACGMEPVFFGEAVAGDRLPNLTYLLAFANPAEKDAAWARFRAHPDWLKLKADPQYKDTANKITNIVLRPSKGSQL
jgi:hypothetical protein